MVTVVSVCPNRVTSTTANSSGGRIWKNSVILVSAVSMGPPKKPASEPMVTPITMVMIAATPPTVKSGTAALQQPCQDIAAEIVGAEPGVRIRRREGRAGNVERIDAVDRRPEQGGEHQKQQHNRADDARRAAGKLAQRGHHGRCCGAHGQRGLVGLDGGGFDRGHRAPERMRGSTRR